MFMGIILTISLQPPKIFANNLPKYSYTNTFFCRYLEINEWWITVTLSTLSDP